VPLIGLEVLSQRAIAIGIAEWVALGRTNFHCSHIRLWARPNHLLVNVLTLGKAYSQTSMGSKAWARELRS